MNILTGGTKSTCGAPGGYGLAVSVYRWIEWITFTAVGGDYCQQGEFAGIGKF